MDRYPPSDFDTAVDQLPNKVKGVEVNVGNPEPGTPGSITGYSYDRLLNCLLYLQPWNASIATDHVMRVTAKQRLDTGAERYEFLSKRIRDGYNLIPGLRIEDRPDQLVILPAPTYLYNNLVNFAAVKSIMADPAANAWIKPHPDTGSDILSVLEEAFPERILPKEDMLYPYVRAAKKLWITTQSEVGIAAIFHNKPFGFLDDGAYKGPVPSLRTFYNGCGTSPVRIGMKDKLIRCLSYPESGLIPVGTGNEANDIQRFFTQYVLHRHVGE